MGATAYARLIKEELENVFSDCIKDLDQKKIQVEFTVSLPECSNLFTSSDIYLTIALKNCLNGKTVFFSIQSNSLKEIKTHVDDALNSVILVSRLF